MATCGMRSSEKKEGYMFKEGGNMKSWKKRYFVLKENSLTYYKTKDSKKVCGSIDLTEGTGVRERKHCACDWPAAAYVDYSFGVATKTRTYYFYTTPDEETAGNWKRIIQSIIEEVGDPNPNWKKDHHGKPEEAKSFFARKFVSVGSKFAKEGIKHAPVNDKVKKSVGAGADMVKEQADADPHAGIGERAAMGVKGGTKVVGATGAGGPAVKATAGLVGVAAEVTQEECKRQKV